MIGINKGKITTFWGVSIIIMEAVVVFFIFYILYFFWIENPTPTDNILIVRAVTKRGLVIPNSVNTADWYKYNNNDFGFSFQYPSDYTVAEDEISYGNNEGKVLDLTQDESAKFSLRIFNAQADETVPDAYQRITSVNPSVYQMYTEEVDDQKAVIYRKKTGEATADQIYFIGNNKFFEMNFNKMTSKILSTFQFTK